MTDRSPDRPDQPGSAPSARDPVDALVDVVLAVPGVEGLHAGVFGEVATYLPGRRVIGLRLRGEDVDVHVELAWGQPVLATADRVREALARHVTGQVNVTVEDIRAPENAADSVRDVAHPKGGSAH